MATDLHIEGPFAIQSERNGVAKRIQTEHGIEFWKCPNVRHLKLKQGCYVFAMQASKGYKPWYVGKSGTGFFNEIFKDHKLKKYNEVLFSKAHGTPVMFFVTPIGNHRKVPSAELTHMEKELTQFALKKNPDLSNIQNTKNTPKWSIKGVVRSGPGKPTLATKSFKTMMKM